MTGRVLRIELRRSAAFWTGPLVLVLGAVMLYALIDRTWGGRWTQLALWQREYLLLLIPLVIGAGAWQGRRESKARVGELLLTTARPAWQPATVTAVALATAAALGYVGAFATGIPQLATTATFYSSAWVPVVGVGALVLVASAVAGLAVGRLLPYRLTPPAAAIVGLVTMVLPGMFFGEGGRAFDLLEPIGFTSFQSDFTTFSARVHLLQALEFGGLAATGLLAIAASRAAGRLLALLPVVAALAVTAALVPTGERAGMVLDPGSYAPVCTVDKAVCVTKVHARALDDLNGPARRALSILAAKLPDPPTKVIEDHTRWTDLNLPPQPADTVPIGLSVKGDGHLDKYTTQNLLPNLLDGAGTRQCGNMVNKPLIGRYLTARAVAGDWLLGTPPDAGYTSAFEAYRTLTQLPAAQQRARVAALRQAALACDGRDLLDLLVGKGGTA